MLFKSKERLAPFQNFILRINGTNHIIEVPSAKVSFVGAAPGLCAVMENIVTCSVTK